jgi:tRNA U34 2-thiouridine synthase MnmA/TrmU
LGEEFLQVLKNPRHGFGANLNPCIDCKILMLSKAREMLPKWGANFVITGEVLGQRPMSQNRATLQVIEKGCGLSGYLLRPLSAKLLDETIPEKELWVRRDELLGLSGRSRKPQIELAKDLGIADYQQPAGGCLLTDPGFSQRMRELLRHEGLTLENIELLKIGRHFRLSDRTKLVVGRNEKENAALLGLRQERDCVFMPPEDMAGPTGLGRGVFSAELLKLSCAILARYCDLNGAGEAKIICRNGSGKESIIVTSAAAEEQLAAFRI